jgi:hypothetical protein
LTRKIVFSRVSTPGGALSISHFSTVGASMKWFCPTSRVPAWALYSFWKTVRGAGVARPLSAVKKLDSQASLVYVTS